MKEILLANGNLSLINDIDFDYINQYNWHEHKARISYAVRDTRNLAKTTGKQIFMQYEIITLMGLIVPMNMTIDHIDRNGLNNQRENLRIVTYSDNRHNSKIRSDNSTGTKGISFSKSMNKWQVKLNNRGIEIYREYFNSFEEAVIAREKAEKAYLGVSSWQGEKK